MENPVSEQHDQDTEAQCVLENKRCKGVDGADLTLASIKVEDVGSGEDSNQSFCFEMPLEVELGQSAFSTPAERENPDDPIETIFLKTEPAAEGREAGSDAGASKGGPSRGQKETCKFKLPPLDPTMVSSEMVAGRKTYICNVCAYRTTNNSNIRKHQLSHTRPKREKAKKKKRTKTYFCEFCPYNTNNSYNLKKHLMIHSGDRPIECDLCDFRCITASDLIRHKRKHSGERPFACRECGSAYTQAVHLKHHVQGVHSKVESYRCEQCDYKTAIKKNLNRHVTKHLTGRTYSCDDCSYRTICKPDLIKHVTKHLSIGS